MKILYITTSKICDSTYGGAKASIGRYEILKRIANVDTVEVIKKSNIASGISIVQNIYPPLTKTTIKKIVKRIDIEKYDIIYVDSSVCGKLIKAIKMNYSNIPVIALFQNCERDYNAVRFGKSKGLKRRVYYRLVQVSELLTLNYSDFSIALTKRDSNRLFEIYGKRPNEIVPLFIKDEFDICAYKDDLHSNKKGRYCLLFGPSLYPNVEAARWFTKNVSPHLAIDTLVAGKGFDSYKEELERNSESVIVRGYIDNIEELYKDAVCVCIPLFSGGGMKVKTIEALMFGKTIFGTDEAFAGFDFDITEVGGVCNDADCFINIINEMLGKGGAIFNDASREIYEKKYSDNAVLNSYKRIIENLIS